MILELKRDHGTEGYTHGKLSIDGDYFCHTIEDEERDVKLAGKTAIACGNYKVVVTMSNRFKQLMPLLLNVPNFEGVRIHAGNTASDTDGCILVGKPYRADFITDSRKIYTELFKRINEALADQQIVTIEIT